MLVYWHTMSVLWEIGKNWNISRVYHIAYTLTANRKKYMMYLLILISFSSSSESDFKTLTRTTVKITIRNVTIHKPTKRNIFFLFSTSRSGLPLACFMSAQTRAPEIHLWAVISDVINTCMHAMLIAFDVSRAGEVYVETKLLKREKNLGTKLTLGHCALNIQ